MRDTPETARPETLASELKEFRSEILDDWMAAKLAVSDLANTEVSLEVDREQTSDLLDDFVALVDHGDLGNEATSPFRALKDSLEQIAYAQAAAGMSISDIGRSIVSLKDALHNHQERHAGQSVAPLTSVVDRLLFDILEGYVARREGFIASIIESAADGIITCLTSAPLGHIEGFS